MVIIGTHFKKDYNALTTFPADELYSLSGMSSELAVRSLTAQLMTALFPIPALKQQQVFVHVCVCMCEPAFLYSNTAYAF